MPLRTTDTAEFIAQHRGFFDYLLGWYRCLQPMALSELTGSGARADEVLFVGSDVIKAFTTEGVLASERVAGIVPNVVDLLRRAHDAGCRDFVLIQDSHPEDSLQFDAYGPHAVRGSREAETADELLALPFADEFVYIYKESLSPAIGTCLEDWLRAKPGIRNVVVVGDCTDICTYHFALWFRMWSNAFRKPLEVIVPEDCTETYDVSVETADRTGATPHDADLLHLISLYHMALNGVRVVSHIA